MSPQGPKGDGVLPQAVNQATQRVGRAQVADLLACGASHELNNIFALLLMQLEVLRLQGLSTDAQEAVDGLVHGVRRGISVVENLLHQASSPPGSRVAINPKYVANGIQRRSAALVGEGISVVTQYPDALPIVEVEPRGLLSVLSELCRAAGEDGRGVTVKLEADPGEGEAAPAVTISVQARGWLADSDQSGKVAEDCPVLGGAAQALAAQGGWVTAQAAVGLVKLHLPLPATGGG